MIPPVVFWLLLPSMLVTAWLFWRGVKGRAEVLGFG